jgi:hypothetical protein
MRLRKSRVSWEYVLPGSSVHHNIHNTIIAQYRGSVISPWCKGIRFVLSLIRYTPYCIVDNIVTQYAILRAIPAPN